MSKLLANQISNYNDDGPVEVKDGVNIPTGKPFQVAGAAGTSVDGGDDPDDPDETCVCWFVCLSVCLSVTCVMQV